MEFRYKPTTTRTPPTKKRINGGQMLSGNISVISLGKLITRPNPPIKKITCSESWMLAQTYNIEPIIRIKILIISLSIKSSIKMIEPIEIVEVDKKYPSQLGMSNVE